MEAEFPQKIFDAENSGIERPISGHTRTNRVHGHHPHPALVKFRVGLVMRSRFLFCRVLASLAFGSESSGDYLR